MLKDFEKEDLIKLIQENKEIPENFKYYLFPSTQKEYELSYYGKIRKEDLLANEDGVFPVPIQVEKFYGENKKNDWNNIIAFGDNLQFLKTLYENKDPVIKDKVKGKIKLIYIDPPFSTENDFKNKSGNKAYTDKKSGSKFIEFLRRRIIVSKELLSDEGFLIIHLDQKKESLYKNNLWWNF